MSDMIKNDEELEEERLEEERKAHLEDLENGVSTDEETISDTESHLTESFMSRPMSGTRMSTEFIITNKNAGLSLLTNYQLQTWKKLTLGLSLVSGKEARQARSARIRAAHEGKKPLDANR